MNSSTHLIDRVLESAKKVDGIVKEVLKENGLDNGKKLEKEERYFLINLIAHCYSLNEIQFEMFNKFQKNVSTTLIYQYKHTKKWVPVIKKLREEYCIDVDASPMASKRVRLDRLDRAYNRAVEKSDITSQIKAVSQSQREKEGLHAHGDINVYWSNPTYQQLNVLSTEELLKRQKLATQKLLEGRENGPDRNTEENQK